MGFQKMKLLYRLKVPLQRSGDHQANIRQEVRALSANGVLAAQIDAWVNEGGSGNEVGMKPLNILVIEDDALQGMMLDDILEDMGHRVCAVTSTVSSATAAFEKHQPELLIVDAWLKDGSGLSAVDHICKNAYVPHLFVSGDISTIKLARPDAVVIQKPYRVVELEAAIERAMILRS